MSFFDEIKVTPKKKQVENTIIKNGITRWLKEHLKDSNYVYYKNWGGGFGRAGRPDIEIVYKGIVSYWELKDPEGYVSTLQKEVISRYEKAGKIIKVAESVEEFIEQWEEIYGK